MYDCIFLQGNWMDGVDFVLDLMDGNIGVNDEDYLWFR